MILKTRVKILSEYTGKSKFEFWNDLSVDDIIELRLKLKNLGHYKNTIHLTNITNNSTFVDSQNSIVNYFSNVEFEELG